MIRINKKGKMVVSKEVRARVRVVKYPHGWVIVLLYPKWKVEFPKGRHPHLTEEDAYEWARSVYNNETWAWRERDKSIIIDNPSYIPEADKDFTP
ncbi:MAG: hypothetical protein DDT23_00047 [candidate division WS2 bacterium]|nr:hypothetical protein [Candidatus Lithacetigena glycinireducens]